MTPKAWQGYQKVQQLIDDELIFSLSWLVGIQSHTCIITVKWQLSSFTCGGKPQVHLCAKAAPE
jgi:hypothetical protein